MTERSRKDRFSTGPDIALLGPADAIEFVKQQLESNSDDAKKSFARGKWTRNHPWHYGRCEIAALLSQIYGIEIRPGDLR